MEQQNQTQIIKDELSESCQVAFLKFLTDFTVADEPTLESSTVSRPTHNKYAEQVQNMVNTETTTMYVDFNDVSEFDDGLATTIQLEFYRVHNYLRQAVRQFVQSIASEYVQSSTQHEEPKDFFVSFYNSRGVRKLRELDANKIGQLLAFSGTVTRTSEVKPELLFGTFKCGSCDQIVFNIEQQFKYTQPTICPNPTCSNSTDWELLPSSSKFVDWQKVRVQENSTEIPPGSMPRSIDVILRHEIVDKVKAGNGCIFTGTLIVIPDIAQLYRPGEVKVGAIRNNNRTEGGEGVSGLKALGVRDLTYKLAFLANGIQSVSDKFAGNAFVMDDSENTFTEEERSEILRIRHEQNLYQKIVRSLAPNIFGHSDIKRGILLMLCGGVHKKSTSGQQLRGDLNICIVGDPATAKSQFLKYICNFMPRAVYTSGKSSSAAGLTASVVMDQDTGELGIEAGALMLADNGICCIDEFDKMNIVDQVAIHEAMEQQTISISKAGIQATLNARASILAAANPVFGRYDKSRTLRQNINMTAPIMSRFDLFFVIADENNETTDTRVAEHILKMHQEYEQVDSGIVSNADFSMEQLQKYISFARTFNPIITQEAKLKLCENYKKLRRNDNTPNSQQSYRITIRQLESLIRLSEALARVHLDDEVKPVYVDEAFRLLQQSVIRVETKDIVLGYEDEQQQQQQQQQNDLTMEEEGGEESKKKESIMISVEEYIKISHQLCSMVNDLATVVWKDLAKMYVEQNLQGCEDIVSEVKKINLVIKRLNSQEKVLLFADEDDKSDDENRILTLNPNYVIGD